MAEYIRVLRCDQCRTLEETHDYEGDPRHDLILEALIRARHTEPSGTKHVGQLMRVEKQHWETPSIRNEILRQLQEQHGGGSTGFSPEYYTARDTFREDAMACWKQHFRSPDCNDYETGEKRLTPGTAVERKAAGLPRYRSAKDIFLCHFCPVHTKVMESRRLKAGMYK